MNRRLGIAVALILLGLAALAVWRLGGDGYGGGDAPSEPPPAPPPAERNESPRKRPERARPAPAPAPREPAREVAVPAAPAIDVPYVRVVEHDGPDAAGIENASVLVVAGEEELTLATDAAGIARLTGVAGPVSVWAWAADRPTAHDDLVVQPGTEVRMVLPAGRSVRVRFVDASGSPMVPEQVGGAPDHVELVWNGALAGDDSGMFFRTLFGPAAAWRRRVAVRADAGGLQLARPVGPGLWRLFVGLPSGATLLSQPFRGDGEGVLVLELPVPDPAETRRIRVVVGGSGAPGVRVRAMFEYGDDQAFLAGAELVTDEHGEVVVPVDPNPPTGTGARRHRPPTWWAETDTHIGHLKGGRLQGSFAAENVTEMKLQPYSVVEGEAYTSGGAPAAGALVVAYEDGRASKTVVGDDGSYRLEGVFASRRKTTIILIEDLTRTQELNAERVEVAPGETARLVFGSPNAANEGGRLVGYVHAGEFPLAGVYVVIDPASNRSGAKGRFGRTDAEGRIVLEGVSPGSYRLKMLFGDPRVSDDHRIRQQEPLEIEAGLAQSFDYDLPAGAIRVVVIDAGTGLPLAGAGTTAQPARDVEQQRFPGHQYRPGWSAFTNDAGEALLPALVPGVDHELRVFADGYEPSRLAGSVPGTMSEPATVEVRLTKSR